MPCRAVLLAATFPRRRRPRPRRNQRKARRCRARGIPYATRDDAMQFADEVAARRGLDRAWVRATIGSARLLPNVPRLMLPAPSGTPKNWHVYRSRFIDPVRIAAGVRFWRDNAATLARAEANYGVPAEIIVGIIGVETIYGRNMGSFRVIDALATLAFDFPAGPPARGRAAGLLPRRARELPQHRKPHRRDPLAPLGSYAGAMGMPQFMPSSIAKYAVDFDGDGRIDLVRSPADVIGSVANYFKAFGWQPGHAAALPVSFDDARR